MQSSLPSLYQQRLRSYKIDEDEAKYTFKLINRYVFDEELSVPNFLIKYSKNHWGQCIGHYHKVNRNSYCTIELNRKFYCVQWFAMILAHEMAHQYQWEIIRFHRQKEGKLPVLGHGPSFFFFKDRLAEYGIPLKTKYSTRRWVKYQDLFKI